MILESLSKAIQRSPISLRQISRETGVDKAVLSRVLNGGSCGMQTAEILFKYFGLKIIAKKKG
jgi:hypothetical protein